MSSGQWEVVNRNKREKLVTQNGKKVGKQEKKTVPPPNVEDILPMSQLKSIYTDVKKSNKENKKPQEKEAKTKVKQPAKKVDVVAKPKPPKNIESALTMINVDDFKSTLDISQQRFPEAPLVWLKELAAYLNAKINVDLNDPVFTTKPDTYPLNLVPSGIKQVMDKALKDAGKQNIQLFFDLSLTTMAHEMSKNSSAIGHKIWIQFLALNHPEICTTHLEKHATLRTSYQNRAVVGLSLLWALGQGGVKDFQIGLKVFKEFMLPLFEMKNYSRFIIKYLKQLLKRNEKSILSKDNYFFLFDLINTKRNLPNELQQDLNAINRQLKSLLFLNKKVNQFFEPLLSKLSHSMTNLCKVEHCDLLLNCLAKDPSCYAVWKSCYKQNHPQTNILLIYIRDHWKKLSNEIDKKYFKDALLSFTVCNTELMKGRSKRDTTVEDSVQICQVLLEKMTSKKSFPWKFLTIVIFTTVGGLLMYDINKNGSWKQTQSVRTLKEIGVWKYSEVAWDRMNEGFNWTRQRIEEYAPGYIDSAGHVMQPYVELGHDLYLVVRNILYNYVKIIQEKTPCVVEFIDKYAPGVMEQAQDGWQKFVKFSTENFQKCYTYITTEVFVGQLSPENIQRVLVEIAQKTQQATMEYFNWAYEKMQSMIEGGK